MLYQTFCYDPIALTGFSAQSAPNATAAELAKPLPRSSYGATTVGDIKAAGGDVDPTTRTENPNHVTVTGLDPQTASDLLTPTVKKPQ